jgi:hypothetical protein
MAKLSINELDEPTRAVSESAPGDRAAYDAAPANVSKRLDPIKYLRLQFNWQIKVGNCSERARPAGGCCVRIKR